MPDKAHRNDFEEELHSEVQSCAILDKAVVLCVRPVGRAEHRKVDAVKHDYSEGQALKPRPLDDCDCRESQLRIPEEAAHRGATVLPYSLHALELEAGVVDGQDGVAAPATHNRNSFAHQREPPLLAPPALYFEGRAQEVAEVGRNDHPLLPALGLGGGDRLGSWASGAWPSRRRHT